MIIRGGDHAGGGLSCDTPVLIPRCGDGAPCRRAGCGPGRRRPCPSNTSKTGRGPSGRVGHGTQTRGPGDAYRF